MNDVQTFQSSEMQLSRPVTDTDIFNSYRFFFGRDPESLDAVINNREASRRDLVAQLAISGEFEDRVVQPVMEGRAPSGDQFSNPPSHALLAWAAGFLPLEDKARDRLARAPNWVAAYATILADPRMRAVFGQMSEKLALDTLVTRTTMMAADLGERSIVGDVEEATGQLVRGYAVDMNAPDSVLGVELWIDGSFVAATRADGYGRDLQERFGGSGQHGFLFEGFTPPAQHDERIMRVEVRESGSKLILNSRRVTWRPAREAHHLALLADELRQARKALAEIERTLKLVSGALGFTPESYDAYWRAYYARTPALVLQEAQEAASFAWRPRFDLVVTADPGDDILLDATRESLDAQIYPLASTTFLMRSNGGAETAFEGSGDYAVLLDAGDMLAPDALHRFAAMMQGGKRPALIILDSDRVENDDEITHRLDPQFRPGFDYDLLLQEPYLGQSAVVRLDVLRAALETGGGLARERRAELWLRVLEQAEPDAARHLPRIVHHAAYAAPIAVNYARTVQEHLDRKGAEASVMEAADPLGSAGAVEPRLRIAWPLPPATRAAVIVPTRDRLDLLGPCLASLEASRASNSVAIEIVVVDNASSQAQTRRALDALDLLGRITLLHYAEPFNWSAINNFAARKVEADVLVFLNNDTVVLTPDWCDELCAQALRPQIGAVGARLLYEDGSIQHAGIVLGTAQALAAHEGAGAPASDDGYLGRRGLVHGAAAVTGACLATRRELFIRLGGFDEARLAIEANDIDYCLRVRSQGLGVLYDPRCTLYHFESRSRGHTGFDPARRANADAELASLKRRWGAELSRDPFYNGHFDRLSRPFTRLGPPPQV